MDDVTDIIVGVVMIEDDHGAGDLGARKAGRQERLGGDVHDPCRVVPYALRDLRKAQLASHQEVERFRDLFRHEQGRLFVDRAQGLDEPERRTERIRIRASVAGHQEALPVARDIEHVFDHFEPSEPASGSSRISSRMDSIRSAESTTSSQ